MRKSLAVLKNGCFILGLAITIAGCASIISGTSQDIQISSTPSTANVTVERAAAGMTVETAWEGTTPATFSLKRKYEYLLTVSLEGYQPVEMTLERGTNGWVWGNLLFGGLIGLIVDFSNGAARKLKPDEIDVQLVAASSMGSLQRSTIYYAVFRVMDSNGHLRISPVPLTPDPN